MNKVVVYENNTVFKFGIYEIVLEVHKSFGNPYTEIEFKIIFIRPSKTCVTVDGFYDGGNTFKARAYCDMVGLWTWRSESNHPDLNSKEGSFEVVDSIYKGKLKIHPEDPHQFAYDNGEWFLHIGDTGYRYIIPSELFWKDYLHQAAASGITKIRTWFCEDRSNVQAMFQHDRKYLNLAFWKEIDKRLCYALEHYPHIIFQLILFGEDIEEVRKYYKGNTISHYAVKYAQARFSSLPNVQWCISNDFNLTYQISSQLEREGQDVTNILEVIKGIKQIGSDMLQREPWNTLITNHQARFSGYSFLEEPWSHIITLEHLGQVTGENILEYRKHGGKPVVLDEDRYEHWREPHYPRYYFRRLMWASILSGGHATYGGLNTFEAYDGGKAGVYGYYDACTRGILQCGAHDFIYLHKFFKETMINMVNMIPEDEIAGGKPLLYKVSRSLDYSTFIIYLANPDVFENHSPNGFSGYYTDEVAKASNEITYVELQLPEYEYLMRWFQPLNGEWYKGVSLKGGKITLQTPFGGDWVLLLQRVI